MTKEEVLTAFGGLSEEDQNAVRSEIVAKGAPCCREEMHAHMAQLMGMMSTSENPTEMCQKMMGMCHEMMEKMGENAACASTQV